MLFVRVPCRRRNSLQPWSPSAFWCQQKGTARRPSRPSARGAEASARRTVDRPRGKHACRRVAYPPGGWSSEHKCSHLPTWNTLLSTDSSSSSNTGSRACAPRNHAVGRVAARGPEKGSSAKMVMPSAGQEVSLPVLGAPEQQRLEPDWSLTGARLEPGRSELTG